MEYFRMTHLQAVADYLDEHKVLIGSVAVGIVSLKLVWPAIFEKRRYPPGPIPLPLIGNGYMLFAGCKAEYRYNNWRKYGKVVSYKMAGEWHVEIYGYDAIYEAFVKHSDIFSGRRKLSSSEFALLDPGLVFGENWKELRRQALIVFRDHGMGKAMIESKISEEIEYLLDALTKLEPNQTNVTFKNVIGKAVANVTNQIVYGRRLEYDDDVMLSLTKFDAFYMKAIKAGLIPGYKVLSRLFSWDPIGFHQSKEHHTNALQFFRDEITRHKVHLDTDNPKDYIDSFLAEADKTGNPIFTDECLASTIEQFYIAGFDTTSTTLTWAILYLLNYPQCSDKLLHEINNVVGNRHVKLSDREEMPYTQAFIHEVFRCASTAPSSLPHVCSDDTEIQGQVIPAGTRVFANLWSTYHDEEIYPDSYSFKPERFLDDQCQVIKQTGKMMLPFSIGKRACLGDGLAKAEMFMFLVSFVQRFHVKRRSTDKLSEEGVDIFTRSPKPFEFILNPRK